MNIGRGLGPVKFLDTVYPALYLFRILLRCIDALDHHLFVCGLLGYGPELKVKDSGVRLLGTGLI